jgi:imidazolonepropionase-like amidohydrolase
VEKGKIADLFAVSRNPLEDISALQEVVQVFKSGRAVLSQKPTPGADQR